MLRLNIEKNTHSVGLKLVIFVTDHAGHGHTHSGMSHNHSRLTQLVSAGASATATDDNENDERFQPPQHYHHDHVHEQKNDSSTQMNMRGVFLHVLADALGSVIVIISASVGKFYY